MPIYLYLYLCLSVSIYFCPPLSLSIISLTFSLLLFAPLSCSHTLCLPLFPVSLSLLLGCMCLYLALSSSISSHILSSPTCLPSNCLPPLCQPPLLHPSTSSQPSPSPSRQDIVGGRFDATQAFVGEMSQFNMWDRVLRPGDIIGMANCSAYMPGNVIPWVDTNVEVMGGATKAPLEICEERAFDS